MLSNEELRLWLAIRLVPDMSRPRFHALMQRFDTPAKVLGSSARELAQQRGMDQELARQVLDSPKSALIDRELELMAAHHVRAVTSHCDDYPANLLQCSAPPPLLYVRGTLHREDRYSVALVGSRHATQYGRAVAQQFASRLAQCGITVVSGFARGVDSASHQAAISAGGRTLGVLGNGLSVCYPAENRTLEQRVIEHGALITEYPMNTSPDRYNFPERNHVIATLSLGTVVVEAAEKSGALISAREALDENRFVFAVPGDITRLNSRGANALICSGARLVQRPEEILHEMKDVLRGYLREELLDESLASESDKSKGAVAVTQADGSSTVPSRSQAGTNVVAQLSEEERYVLGLIQHEPQVFDMLAAQLDPARITVQRLSVVLFGLEMKRAIRQLPGRCYAVLS
ncbi:MAG: DNA-processing protein DprA [Candidatus Sumerlaeaceae bacterium]